jgi:hypothetical protein
VPALLRQQVDFYLNVQHRARSRRDAAILAPAPERKIPVQ